MKYIKKGKEPSSLTLYRKKEHAYFDGYQEKDDLRKSLLKEQKYICCYCMSRIIKKDEIENVDLGNVMKIEHRKSQTKFPNEQLSYNNLLGACNGNEGKPRHLQHCDTHKLHYDGKVIEGKPFRLKIDPTLAICEQQIEFKSTGEIYSKDLEINDELGKKEESGEKYKEGILNLNLDFLIKNRKKTLDFALKKFTEKYPTGHWSNEILLKEIDRWENVEEYQPYCQIVIYHLKKKLNRVS